MSLAIWLEQAVLFLMFIVFARLLGAETVGGGMMAMRHETLRTAGTFDAGMPQWGSEDLELCVRYWLLGYEVWGAPAVGVVVHLRKGKPNKD